MKNHNDINKIEELNNFFSTIIVVSEDKKLPKCMKIHGLHIFVLKIN